MYQAGKVYQVAKEMRRLELPILGVSEIRWTWTGKLHLTTENAVLYYSILVRLVMMRHMKTVLD